MDRQAIAVLIPVIALAIPLSVIVFNGMARIMRLRIEEERVRRGDGETTAELDALRAEVGQLRQELGEVQERLDFTERMLTQVREQQRLPEGTR